MDEIDRELLASLQEDFPLTQRPFLDLGRRHKISEEEVIERLSRLQIDGLIRRIGPVLDLRKMGLGGVLVALQVPVDEADEVAGVVSQYPEVSHNYLRPNSSGYNLWFTISADECRIEEILRDISARTGRKMMLLPAGKIFKIGVKFDII